MNAIAERAEAIAVIEAHFEQLQVGLTDVQQRRFTDDDVRAYAALHQIEYPGRYVDAKGNALVLPAMFFLRPAVTFGLRQGPPMALGGIFTQTHRRYRRPARVDEPVVFRGEVAAKYEHRGFFYIAVDWQATDDADVALANGREWHTLGFVRREEGPVAARLSPPGFASAIHRAETELATDDRSGRDLRGPTVSARLPRDWPGVHNDAQARRAGLDGGAVINEFHFGHLTELLMDELGPHWLHDGEIEVKYVAPLRDGETLTPGARVMGTAEDGRIVLDLWCENQNGERIAVGRASCGHQLSPSPA